ncbi:hypothetical protein A9Q86_08580 [Flavobacteriales bacterium 33_180_T64]|nr:hypothetical protein A9Q86_08580 [Flavobacteriales bacterium 33_180_T64]
MTFFKIIDKYLICIVLVAVALIQIYHSQFDRLTPWKGGGFGMFSTNKRANVTAVGYTSDGDSLIINVIGSKFDVPISRNFLSSTKNFPKKEKLERLGALIVNSYLQPQKLEIPSNIDRASADLIKGNEKFYSTAFIPKYYQSDDIAKSEKAIKIDRVKITLYETDFFEDGLSYKKRYVDEIQIVKKVNKLK